ncbi:hypothetical protein OBBRIDRAFT_790288 [Obba rivulosa]|uniref:Carrier domain-containing protein n=1 Tax=Obba rivulosa TaxID=1052685 RepID=A0A8E2DPK2_9APHY|nr:hypothetical protein OBBRIDRAFT_790288 [Obba rivulosa]
MAAPIGGHSQPGCDHADIPNLTAVISGYRHCDLPDLSARRSPPSSLYSVSSCLKEPLISTPVEIGDAHAAFASLVAAIGRVLGAYCGCTDVLLAFQDQDSEDLRAVRITWDEHTQWTVVVRGILQTLSDGASPRVTLHTLREALGLNQKQAPCIAIVRDVSHGEGGHADFPMTFCWDNSDLTLRLSTSERHLHPSGADLLISQIAALFVSALVHPSSPISCLPEVQPDLLSVYEKFSFEDRCKVYSRVPPVRLATDHLALRLGTQARDIAVKWYGTLSGDSSSAMLEPETMTYDEWHHKANQMARWLIEHGVQRSDKVAVCMKRDIDYHIALIAVLRAGACYVPIDPELPAERQGYIARDSNARFVLVSSETSSASLFGDAALGISSDEARSAIATESDADLDIATPGDISYLLYTSGTTGIPKGCVLTHEGLSEAVWGLSAVCAAVDMEEGHVGNYLSIASVAFDVHLAEIFVALARGIPIVSAPRSTLLEDLPYYIKTLEISHLGIVPSLIEATMGSIQEDEAAGIGTTLRYIASGGEKMSDAILDKWADHPKVKLANFYGPSEVTIGCAARFMDKTTPRANIGHPFANVSAFVVDENMNILLRGSPGELVVEGPLVGVGYHGRPDLTEKVFLEFPERGVGRWAYRTGDFVRMMPDGTLEVIGRIDTQIKLRGVRIESEGISSIARNAALPDYNLDVVTILGKHPTIGAEQLVSFVVWDQSTSIAVRKSSKPTIVAPPEDLLPRLSIGCERELASYMRPSHFIPLSFMPLNSNGKNDAKLLGRLFEELEMDVLASLMTRDSSHSGHPSTAGRMRMTETETRVFEVARKYLHIPQGWASPDTTLLRYGLDSMSAVRLAAELRREFSKFITASDILRSPTIEHVASVMDAPSSEDQSQVTEHSFLQRFSAEWMHEVGKVYPLRSIAAIYPPFPLQEGILYRSVNADTLYVQHVLVECLPGISIEKLREAWIDVVASSPILRTVFHFGRQLVQVVLDTAHARPDMAEETVQCDSVEEFITFFADRQSPVASEINRSLTDIPPHRLTVFKSQNTEHVFMSLSIHHALFDGISLSYLLRHLEKSYLGEPRYLSAPPEVVLDSIASVDLHAAQAFWTQQFVGFDWSRIPSRTASAKRADQRSISFRTGLSGLQQMASQRQVTLQTLLMSAFARFLAKHIYGQSDVVFGVIRSGRSLPVSHIESTILPLLSVLPVRVDCASASDVLHCVQKYNAEVTAYEHITLSKVQQWVRPGVNVFETLFSLSYKDDGRSAVWRLLESHNPEPDYILAVEIVLDSAEDHLTMQIAYTSEDISSDIVDYLVDEFESLTLDLVHGIALNADLHSTADSATALTASEQTTQIVDDDGEEISVADEDLLLRLRLLVADFLQTNVDLVTEDTSLIALGLDSIRSVGLSRVLRREGIDLTSAEIMRLATPRRMAASAGRKISMPSAIKHKVEAFASAFAVERNKIRDTLDTMSIILSADDHVDIFPVTTLQAGMLSQTVSSSGRRYVHLFPLCLSSEVDITALREAWNKTVHALDILRTTFHFVPDLGVWTSAVHSTSELRWSEVTLSKNASLLPLLDSVKITDAGCSSPPYHLYLIRSDAADSHNKRRLVLVMHHALYDGVSVSKLLDTVQNNYYGQARHDNVQFASLLPEILWQERLGTSFWVERLKGSCPGLLPPRALDEHILNKSHVAYSLIDVSRNEVERTCRAATVTTQCIGQYAFAKLLASLTESADILFGHVVSGRNLTGAEDVIGPVLNTVPCRVRFTQSQQNKRLLQAIHSTNVAALSWQHASLRSIQQYLKVERLWDCLFVYQPSQALDAPERESIWDFDHVEDEDLDIQYGFNLELHETANGYQLKAACSDRLMSAEQLSSALKLFGQFFHSVVDNLDGSCLEGLPEFKLTEPSIVSPLSQLDADFDQAESQWDTRSSAIREMLSAATGIPTFRIQMSTRLLGLGIDSISSIQIASKARRRGLHLTARDIIQSRTVADLVKRLQNDNVEKSTTRVMETKFDIPNEEWPSLVPKAEEVDVETVTVTTAGMQWFIGAWQRSGESRYQHVFGFELPADIDVSRLYAAWDELLKRHAILRATFARSEQGESRLVIHKRESMGTRWTEEALDDSEEFNDTVSSRMRTLVSSPPPMQEPLTRAILLRSSSHNALVIRLHHFQYDAWSLQLLLSDLFHLYQGERPPSSNDLSAILRVAVPDDRSLVEQRSYWRRTFSSSDAAFRLFPKRTLDREQRSGKHFFYLEKGALASIAALEGRARAHSVALHVVYLACWAQVQATVASSDVATFGLWHSGRTGAIDQVERLATPCLNILPLAVRGVRQASTMDIAKKIQDDLRERTPIVEQTPLVRVDDWVGGANQPLCNVFVNIVKAAPEVQSGCQGFFNPIDAPYFIPDVSVRHNNSIPRMKVTDLIQDDIIVDIVDIPGRDEVAMSIEFADDTLDMEMAKAMVAQWAQLVEACLM